MWTDLIFFIKTSDRPNWYPEQIIFLVLPLSKDDEGIYYKLFDLR